MVVLEGKVRKRDEKKDYFFCFGFYVGLDKREEDCLTDDSVMSVMTIMTIDGWVSSDSLVDDLSLETSKWS